jgi:hypothetical protein
VGARQVEKPLGQPQSARAHRGEGLDAPRLGKPLGQPQPAGAERGEGLDAPQLGKPLADLTGGHTDAPPAAPQPASAGCFRSPWSRPASPWVPPPPPAACCRCTPATPPAFRSGPSSPGRSLSGSSACSRGDGGPPSDFCGLRGSVEAAGGPSQNQVGAWFPS